MNIEEMNRRIQKVMKTDATFAREADFMMTHVPFRQLYDFIPESGNTNYEGGKAHYYINPDDYKGKFSFDENDLLMRFLDNPDEHKFLLIQGNSGTGKSNLIRWIYYMYQKRLKENDDEKEQIIFIQRSYNSLKDAVKRILDYKILPEDRTRYYMDKIGGGGQEASGDELAATVYAMLEVAISYDQDYDQYIDEDVYEGLKELLSDKNIRKYVFMKENGPINRFCLRISGNRNGHHSEEVQEDTERIDTTIFSEKDFSFNYEELSKILTADGHKPTEILINSANGIFQNPGIRREIVSYLNSMNEKVIARSSTLDAADVKGIFKEIRKELHIVNKRLTLFIEDINAYTGMDRALIEILIDDEEDDDLKREMCRLKSMVGSTDNFYDLLHTSLKARITDSIVVLDESVLSDEEKLLEFAARYINAVNLTAEDVDNWYYKQKEMPIAEIKNRVTSVEINGTPFSIFPFTKEAILNLFKCLDLNYRTPRGLLKYVIKQTLVNWNTMEDKIFDNSKSFINVGIRSFSALKMPKSVNQSIIDMSAKEKQYIQIWGFDYATNKIVNNSDNERILFKINVANDIEVFDEPSTAVSDKTFETAKKATSKKERALNHIEEWEKNINKNFVIHKDMRDWIGKYIVSQINWQREDVLYSRAVEVCKALSFIEIEGHEGQGKAELIIERSTENADFFRALTYWNYDGDKKNWTFSGGMEEKIIAKAWLEKNKVKIISAVNKFGKSEQISPEYVVRAKLYTLISRSCIKTLSVDGAIEALVRSSNEGLLSTRKNSKWQDLASAMEKNDKRVDYLFKEYFYRVVGSRSVTNATYTFVDIAFLRFVVEKVIEEMECGKDSKVTIFGNKNLEAPVETINIYHQFKEEAISISQKNVRNASLVLQKAFGKNISMSVVATTVRKMQQYLEYVNRKLNQITPANLITCLENTDTHPILLDIVKKMNEYNMEQRIGEQIVIISTIDEVLLKSVCDEIENFFKFMEDIEKKYTSNLNKNVEIEINLKKREIESLVNKLIGGVE